MAEFIVFRNQRKTIRLQHLGGVNQLVFGFSLVMRTRYDQPPGRRKAPTKFKTPVINEKEPMIPFGFSHHAKTQKLLNLSVLSVSLWLNKILQIQ